MTTHDSELALLHLEHPRGNAINRSLIGSITQALDALEADARVRAVVLTGTGNIFCTGLDLKEIHAFDRPAMSAFVDAFESFFARIFTFPKPLVAAINGHAIAGGTILALCCDRRIAAAGEAKLGLTEVVLGIPFPSVAFEIAKSAMQPSIVSRWLLEGRRHTVDEARDDGIVDQVVSPGSLVDEARSVAAALGSAPPRAYATIKRDLRADALAQAHRHAEQRREQFLDAWVSAEATEARSRLLARLDRPG